ncbi:MAG: hypothetical protein SVR08_15265, partial [Spirochaetota bacterium]|nr:hypothetical protein [Spirochaetota bacterium]
MEKEEIIKNKIIDKGSSPNGFSDSPKQVDVDEFTADFDNTDDKPLNIAKIRDRTFNKELSEILADIRSNELEYNDDEVALDEITEMELLKRFHELFYKAIHLDNLQNVNTSKNPYLYPDIFLEDDCEKKIADEMNRLLYPEFAILAYNPKKKCYSPVHFYSDVLVEDNIAVYTSEELYAQILVNRCGVIIDQQTITDNIFLKKRFSSISEDQSHYLLYFVSFQNILKEIFDEMNLSNGNNQTNYRFQILMIILKDSRSEDIVEVIYKKIKDNLTFYFLKLENKLLNKVNELDFEDPNIIYNIFVYIYQILPTFS